MNPPATTTDWPHRRRYGAAGLRAPKRGADAHRPQPRTGRLKTSRRDPFG